MPSSQSAHYIVKGLLGSKKINDDQWNSILEYHREILVRHMKTFPLAPLGDMACLESTGNLCHALSVDNPKVYMEMPSSLNDFYGLFAGTPFVRKHNFNTYRTFGVDRKGSWILIEVQFSLQGAHWNPTHAVYEKATAVTVSKVDLLTLLKETGIQQSSIWQFFRVVTHRWVSDRKSKYETALKVAESMWQEDAMVSLIDK